MAGEDLEDIKRYHKELEKRAKEQVKSQKADKKKAKKKRKMEKKVAKQERKLRRKGIYPMDLPSPEEEGEIIEAEEFIPAEWVRKSTDTMPLVEKKIDLMAQRREESSLHSLFEEKYGESLIIPETVKEYELSESEKRRLEAITRAVDEIDTPIQVGAPVEAQAEGGAQTETGGSEKKKKKKKETKALKPIWNPWQLWLYTKIGADKMIVLKIIILLISIILWVASFPLRFVIWSVMFLIGKIKSRKSKKATSEAS